MIFLPEYNVTGEDGQEYGLVADDQIRKWIMEARLERKSPLKSNESRDLVFLYSLPEFADAFLQLGRLTPKSQRQIWLTVLIIAVIVGFLSLKILPSLNYV